MLEEVINLIRATDRPVSLQTLSQKLSVEQSALSGMLDLLVRKGKLDIIQASASGSENDCDESQCLGCIKANACPFIAKMPVTYALKETDLIDRK